MKRYRLPILISCIFLAIALVLGVVFGTVSLVKNNRAVLSYHGVTVDEPMYRYFASTYKGTFIQNLKTLYGVTDAGDSEAFFKQIDPETGKSYGALFEQNLEEYVRTLLISSYLFDRSIGLSKSDKELIQRSISLIIKDDEKAFDREVGQYGFDADAVRACAELIYKASRLRALYRGNVSATEDPEACNAFYRDHYTLVTLLFIRTETVFLYDESGNRLTDSETGYDAVRSLDSAERAKREEDILLLRGGIEALHKGENGAITEIAMREFLKTYYRDDSLERADSGYYLSSGEGFTKELSELLPSVVSTALALPIGDFAEVVVTADDYSEEELSLGTPFIGSCFIYRRPLPDEGYTVAENAQMFAAFYSGVGAYTLQRQLSTALPEVKHGGRFGTFSPVTVPYTYLYTVKF